MSMMERLRNSEAGATAVEYGIMVALIAVVIIGAVFALGGNLSDLFDETADCIEDPDAAGCEETDDGGGGS